MKRAAPVAHVPKQTMTLHVVDTWKIHRPCKSPLVCAVRKLNSVLEPRLFTPRSKTSAGSHADLHEAGEVLSRQQLDSHAETEANFSGCKQLN